MTLTTPLRYPGGKSKAIKKMAPYFPKIINEYREPFLGGGSVAIYITQQYPDAKIWVNDAYEPLINFWKVLQSDGEKLADLLATYKLLNLKPEQIKSFYIISRHIIYDYDVTNLYRAASFYVVNKCSFSGSTESGGYSQQAADGRFTLSSIERLRKFSTLIKDWKITNYDYAMLLKRKDAGRQEIFIYCDPPYEIKQSLYGKGGDMQNGFEHAHFAKSVSNHPANIMISYNSDDFIKNRFIKWRAIEFDHPYSMISTKKYRKAQRARNELILFNYKSP